LNETTRVNVYTVSIKADSPIFCAEEVTITQEGILPRAPLVLTSSATVNAGANQTAVNITFSGAASFLDDSDPVTDDEEDSARLKASDFTASGIGGIGKVSTTGNIVTVTVTLIRNTTASNVVVTAGVNPVSSKVTGSAAAVTITQNPLKELIAGDDVTGLTAIDLVAQVEFTGATGITALENGDFTVSGGGMVTGVSVASDVATVTVLLTRNFDTENAKVTTVGISKASTAISGETFVSITQEPGVTVLLIAGANVNVAQNVFTADVKFTGATGLSLTKDDFKGSFGVFVKNAVVAGDEVTVSVLLTGFSITSYTVGVNLDSLIVHGDTVVTITKPANTPIISMLTFDTLPDGAFTSTLFAAIETNSGGGLNNLVVRANPVKIGNTSDKALAMEASGQGGGRAAQINLTTPANSIEFDWLVENTTDSNTLLFQSIVSIQDNIGNNTVNATYPNKYITFFVMTYNGTTGSDDSTNSKIYYFVGNPNAALLGDDASNAVWEFDGRELSGANNNAGAEIPEWLVDTGLVVDSRDGINKWYRTNVVLNPTVKTFTATLTNIETGEQFVLADKPFAKIAGTNYQEYTGKINSVRFTGSRVRRDNTANNGNNLSIKFYYDNIITSGAAATYVNAPTPIITTQPAAATVDTEATVHSLSVVITELPAGNNVTYQWYSEAVNIAGTTAINRTGTPIGGATSATYEYPVDTTGDFFYFVEITNTIADNSDGGIKSTKVRSNAVKVTVNTP